VNYLMAAARSRRVDIRLAVPGGKSSSSPHQGGKSPAPWLRPDRRTGKMWRLASALVSFVGAAFGGAAVVRCIREAREQIWAAVGLRLGERLRNRRWAAVGSGGVQVATGDAFGAFALGEEAARNGTNFVLALALA
jgi:hypothetical protein